MILKYTIAWIGLMCIGIFNGVIREATYGRLVGDLAAHQISTATGVILIGVYVWILSRCWVLPSAGQAVAVGLIWLIITVIFEFFFGHYVMKNPWSRLLYDYNILEGRVWIIILIWTAIAPYAFFRLKS